MPTNVEIPSLGESVSEAVLIKWLKNDGDAVSKDDPVAELETDKANVDLPSPAAGVLRHAKEAGETVHIGETIGRIDEGAAGASHAPASEGKPADEPSGTENAGSSEPASTLAKPQDAPAPASAVAEDQRPSVRRLAAENEVDLSAVSGTGPGGHITKEDVSRFIEARGAASPGDNGENVAEREKGVDREKGAERERTSERERVPNREMDPVREESQATRPALATAFPAVAAPSAAPSQATPPASAASPGASAASAPAPTSHAGALTHFDAQGLQRVPMSKMRKRIARTLVEAQRTAAILTTYNEVDLSAVMALRAKYKERFNEVYGVSLGLMSFFARSVVLALREFPRVNAMIDGDDIVYHNFVHLGIAVSTDRGLAVPILRHAESMSFARIEAEIKRLAAATREGKLGLAELSGGTFTITNGGVFGSLFSTPILNPPQSGILGMHAIQKRPMAIGDKIEIRPMMYVALSYDHRIVDGRESVSFLVRMKEYLEDPARLMLEI
jgi:2-oxoglutarate dehydrogenase E2 component (dihydrolipoamide succinyltransferase)